MAKYEIRGPDGGTYEVNAPDGMSMDQVKERFKSEFAKMSEPEPTSTASAMLQGAGQGLTFGFSDEIEGGARALYDTVVGGKDFSKSYDRRLATARNRLKNAQETNPYAFYGAELGSALVVPGGLAKAGIGSLSKAAAKQGLGTRMKRGALEGAAYGTAYGAGTGEGVEGRIAGAGAGAALGGTFGAALPPLVDAAGAAVRGVTQPVRSLTNPRRVAAEKYAEAVARDLGGSNTAKSFDVAAQRMGTRASKVPPKSKLMSMDLAGENTRRLVRQAADMPSDRVQALHRRLDTRQANQFNRLEQGLASTIGDPKHFASTVENIAVSRQKAAGPNFAKAYAQDIKFPPSMTEFFNRPTMKGIIQNVEKSLADRGLEPNSQNAMQIVHRIKMQLDKQIKASRTAQRTGQPGAGWDLNDLLHLKNTLVRYARRQNKHYGKALDEFAGPSALQGAAEDGFDRALKVPVEDIPGILKDLSRSEQEMWRLGAARAIAGKGRTGNRMNDRTKNVFGSPDMDMRLKAIIPNARLRRQFQRRVIEEAQMAKSRAAVQGGSKTSQNLIQSDEAGKAVGAVSAAGQAATGRLGPIMSLLEGAANRVSGLNPQVAGHIIDNAMYSPKVPLGPYVQNAIIDASRLPLKRARRIAPANAGFAAFRDE